MQAIGHLPIGWVLFALIAASASASFYSGRKSAVALTKDAGARLHSRPNYHGYYVAMWAALPVLVAVLVHLMFGDAIARAIIVGEMPPSLTQLPAAELETYLSKVERAAKHGSSGGDRLFSIVTERFVQLRGMVNLATIGLAALASLAAYVFTSRKINAEFRARRHVEGGVHAFLLLCAGIAIATTVGIVASLFFESLRFFAKVPLFDFLFGTVWNAQTNADFGALPLFFGTFMIALIAMVVAVPIGLYAAIYLSEYAGPKFRAWVKPLLEVLAGIPTVVYGFFALLVIAPAIRSMAVWVNESLINWGWRTEPLLAAQPTSALAAGLVMGIMIIPFVSSLSDDVINAVPQSLRDGAFAMGATKSETVKQVVVPAALPGIIASVLLAVSRAIGETMIVVMAAGQRGQISMDPTNDLTTITAQIVAMLTGDSAFDSPKTLSAFALGFVLFIVTLGFNLIALHVVKKYREKYD